LPAGSPHYRAFVGPPDEYDTIGASQFRLLTTLGLGNGTKCWISVRLAEGRRLLIPYLGNRKYVGLDPESWLIEDAIEREIGQNMIALKRPIFYYFDDFAADRCGTDFDYILAHSVLSHTGKDLFRRALASFRRALSPTGLALITVLHAEPGEDAEVEGDEWVYPECVRYSPATCTSCFGKPACGSADPWRHPRQVWYALALGAEAPPPPHFDPYLSGDTIESFSRIDAPSAPVNAQGDDAGKTSAGRPMACKRRTLGPPVLKRMRVQTTPLAPRRIEQRRLLPICTRALAFRGMGQVDGRAARPDGHQASRADPLHAPRALDGDLVCRRQG
jgi:SAM-dependent methyltransferase